MRSVVVLLSLVPCVLSAFSTSYVRHFNRTKFAIRPQSKGLAVIRADTDSCNELDNIVIRGKDLTGVVQTVCKFWPASFGQFPVNVTEDIADSLDKVFEAGGIYDTLMSLFAVANQDYCLRKEVKRIGPLNAQTKSCLPVISSNDLDELDFEDADKFEQGAWSCAAEQGVRINAVSGMAEDYTSCNCTQRDALDMVVRPSFSLNPRPDGCKMVHRGECYGSCPKGYRPTFFIGNFRPVCTSVCAATDMPFTCGVGCASSRTACVSVILNQIKEVAIAASRVVGFLTGTTAVQEVVIQVVRVAEFVLNVVPRIVAIGNTIYKLVLREKAEMSLLVAIFQILKDEGAQLGKDWGQFSALIGGATAWMMEAIDAEYGWASINLEWISGIVGKYGLDVLGDVFNVAKAFSYKACSISSDEVAFVVEEVGDSRFIGAWSHDGWHHDKRRYRLIANRENVMLEWDKRAKSWSTWVMDKTFGRGWWFGWMGMGWREMYESTAQTDEFPTTEWKFVEGANPPPMLVNAQNGGEDTDIVENSAQEL